MREALERYAPGPFQQDKAGIKRNVQGLDRSDERQTNSQFLLLGFELGKGSMVSRKHVENYGYDVFWHVFSVLRLW